MPEVVLAPLHRPVLIGEVVDLLQAGPGRSVLDCTCGLGGHSEAILESGAEVVGIDRDPVARALAAERLSGFGSRFSLQSGTFADVATRMREEGRRFHAVLADLGVSSLQIDDPERGFGIHATTPADMRMGDDCPETALELIERHSESDLADIIYRYGEERLSRRIARVLKREMSAGRLETASDLAAAVRTAVPGRHQRHPALRTFQALRIAVNDELGQLDALLGGLPDLLLPGGVAVIISFHSLEDRAVKVAFRAGRESGLYAGSSRKVVTASPAEIAANPRSHSAKLRWALRADPSLPPTLGRS